MVGRPKGYHHSEATLAKMSATQKKLHLDTEYLAKVSAGLMGKHPSEETKAKQRAAKLGRKLPAEHRAKMSESAKRRCANQEWKAKMSKFMTGRPGWWLGKTMSSVSNDKRRASLVGEKHWNWKGGITGLSLRVRRSTLYRQWRDDVFTRDDFTCHHCGKRGGNVHAHHVVSFAHIMSENYITSYDAAMECAELWNINNGITLCVHCHGKFESSLRKHRVVSPVNTDAQ